MESLALPEHVQRLAARERFAFHCHSGVSCFTECCRELELALSPYDVLRLKNNLALSSQEFLERHAVIEFTPEDRYPRVYLGMVDDGRASCPFVARQGCLVYPDRPGACRAYPLGRGVQTGDNGRIAEFFVLLREPHCQGFTGELGQTAEEWRHAQGLEPYNQFSDDWLQTLGERKLKEKEAETFILALYNLDALRGLLAAKAPEIAGFPEGLTPLEPKKCDEELLALSLNWLSHELSYS